MFSFKRKAFHLLLQWWGMNISSFPFFYPSSSGDFALLDRAEEAMAILTCPIAIWVDGNSLGYQFLLMYDFSMCFCESCNLQYEKGKWMSVLNLLASVAVRSARAALVISFKLSELPGYGLKPTDQQCLPSLVAGWHEAWKTKWSELCFQCKDQNSLCS